MIRNINKKDIVSNNFLFPQQMELVNSNKQEILYSSGYGGGKTRAGLIKLVLHAGIPNSYCGLFRKTRTVLEKVTLHTLLEPESGLQPILPKGSYEHNQRKSTIRLFGGGTIIYQGFDYPSDILGMNLSCAFIDESILCDEEEYDIINFRMRNTNGLCRQLWSCTNPGSKNHFLYKRFFLHNNPNRQVITSQLPDNFFLPVDYLKKWDTEDKNSIKYKRYYLGEWCNNEYAVYSNLTQDNIKEHDYEEGSEQIWIGLDPGYTNDPFAIIVCGYINRKIYVYEEHYLKNKLLQDVKDILEKYREYKPNLVIDPSAAGIKNELRNDNWRIQDKVNNKIVDGIAIVKSKINNREILIDPRNKELLKEMDLYSYGNTGDIPVDKDNHLCDALRYVVMSIVDNNRQIIKPNIVFLNKDIQDD